MPEATEEGAAEGGGLPEELRSLRLKEVDCRTFD